MDLADPFVPKRLTKEDQQSSYIILERIPLGWFPGGERAEVESSAQAKC